MWCERTEREREEEEETGKMYMVQMYTNQCRYRVHFSYKVEDDDVESACTVSRSNRSTSFAISRGHSKKAWCSGARASRATSSRERSYVRATSASSCDGVVPKTPASSVLIETG